MNKQEGFLKMQKFVEDWCDGNRALSISLASIIKYVQIRQKLYDANHILKSARTDLKEALEACQYAITFRDVEDLDEAQVELAQQLLEPVDMYYDPESSRVLTMI